MASFGRQFGFHNVIYHMGAQWLSGRVLDSRREAAGSSLTGITALCP